MKNLPNILTMVRVILGLIIPFMLIQDDLAIRVIAFFTFVIAAFTDLFDGKISRKYNLITTFGKIMDPIADKVLFFGTLFALYTLNLFPFWIIVVFLMREVAVTIYRLYKLKNGEAIAAEMSGKIKAAVQFVMLGMVYFRLMFRDHILGFPIIETIFIYLMLLSMAIAIYLTLYSGTKFFITNFKKK